MRDAAGEPAEALELLRAQELRLEPLPLGDVAEERDVQAGEEVRSGGRLGDLDRAVDPLCLPLGAGSGRRATNSAQSSSIVASLVRGQELVDLAADQVALGDAVGTRSRRD